MRPTDVAKKNGHRQPVGCKLRNDAAITRAGALLSHQGIELQGKMDDGVTRLLKVPTGTDVNHEKKAGPCSKKTQPLCFRRARRKKTHYFMMSSSVMRKKGRRWFVCLIRANGPIMNYKKVSNPPAPTSHGKLPFHKLNT